MDEKEIQLAMQRLRAIEEEAKRRLLIEKSKKQISTRAVKPSESSKMGSFNSKNKINSSISSKVSKPIIHPAPVQAPKLYCTVITTKGIQCSKYQVEGCNKMCKQHFENAGKDVVMKGDKTPSKISKTSKSLSQDPEPQTQTQTSSMDIEKEPKPKKKEAIPAAIKTLVWNKYIGEKVAEAKCFCCRVTTISMRHHHTGHVLSEKYGGGVTVDNLRPICANCNLSMGTSNMADFISKFGLHK
jgi:hypothetical protein